MRLLAFDSSGTAISAAATEDGRLLALRQESRIRGHAERLLPLLREAMAECGWAWSALDLVAVTNGPGNFTGLRAGIAVARALGLALGRPVLGIGTLEVVAQAAGDLLPAAGLPIVAAVDARRDQVYRQRFTADLQFLDEPMLVPLGDLRRESDCTRAGDPTVWALAGAGGRHEVVEAEPLARYLARSVWRRLERGVVPVVGMAPKPLYLRPPDARIGAGASLVAAVP